MILSTPGQPVLRLDAQDDSSAAASVKIKAANSHFFISSILDNIKQKYVIRGKRRKTGKITFVNKLIDCTILH
jgi:hypothetical protein